MNDLARLGLAEHPEGTVLCLRLQPRARQTAVVGRVGERLKIAVQAPPVDGKANAELCRFLAEQAGVPRSAVSILQGETGRDKRVLVRGCDPATLRRGLGV